MLDPQALDSSTAIAAETRRPSVMTAPSRDGAPEHFRYKLGTDRLGRKGAQRRHTPARPPRGLHQAEIQADPLASDRGQRRRAALGITKLDRSRALPHQNRGPQPLAYRRAATLTSPNPVRVPKKIAPTLLAQQVSRVEWRAWQESNLRPAASKLAPPTVPGGPGTSLSLSLRGVMQRAEEGQGRTGQAGTPLPRPCHGLPRDTVCAGPREQHLVDVPASAIQNPLDQGEFTPEGFQAVDGSTTLPTMNDMGPRSRIPIPVHEAAGSIISSLI